MGDIITAIITAVTSAFTQFMSGVGSGVTGLFKDLFVETVTTSGGATTTQLTTFAAVSFVLMGLGLAIGIFRWLMKKVN